MVLSSSTSTLPVAGNRSRACSLNSIKYQPGLAAWSGRPKGAVCSAAEYRADMRARKGAAPIGGHKPTGGASPK